MNMQLELPVGMQVPIKVICHQLNIEEARVLDCDQKALCSIILDQPKGDERGHVYGLNFWYRYFKAHDQSMSYPELLKSRGWAMQYTKRLDRWKRHCDTMPIELKHSDMVHYLSQHLIKTIVNAKTPYQMNEAVGLTLAKMEMLEKETSQKPLIAVCGPLDRLEDSCFMSLIGQALTNEAKYYLCYDFTSLLRKRPKWWISLYAHVAKQHAYYYEDGIAMELNPNCYSGMLMIGRHNSDYNRFQWLKNRNKLQKPLLYLEEQMISDSPIDAIDRIKEVLLQ